MAKKDKHKITRINHRIFFSLLLFCITWLVYSAFHMAFNGGITYDTVTRTLIEIMPYCFAIAILGYFVGYILDKPNKDKAERESQEMLNKFLKDATDQAAQAAQAARMASPSSLTDDMQVKIDTENNEQ